MRRYASFNCSSDNRVLDGLSLFAGYDLWFGFNSPMAKLIGFKLILLGLTVAFALDAR